MVENVIDAGSIGDKRLRLCILQGKLVQGKVQGKRVSCHGVCRGAFVSESGSGKTEVVMCPIYVDAFDLAVNCSEKLVLRRMQVGVKLGRC